MNTRPFFFLLLWGLVLLLAAPFALRLTIKTDIASLLPAGEPFAVADLVARFPAHQRLTAMIVSPQPITVKERESIDHLAAAIAALPLVDSVRSGVTYDERKELFATLFRHRFHLVPYDREKALRELKLLPIRLTLPGGAALRSTMGADPINVRQSIFKTVTPGGGSVELVDGRFFSPDRRTAYLLIRPVIDDRGIGGTAVSIDQITALFEERFADAFASGTQFRLTGGAALAADAASIMKGDLQRSMLITLIGLTLLFGFAFRSAKPLLLFSPPIIIGATVGVAGVALLWGDIHGLTLGFGIALIGVSIDYLIHLLVATEARGDLRRALREVGPPIRLGFISTELALAVLSFSAFPIIREISFLGLLGLATAFAVSMTLSASLLNRHRQTKAEPVINHSGASIGSSPLYRWGIAIVTLILFFFALDTRYDGDMKKLSRNSPEVWEAFETMRAAFGSVDQKQWMVISDGRTGSRAMSACTALADALHAERLSFRSPCGVIPSGARQNENLNSYRVADLSRLESAVAALPMRSGVFARFYTALDEIRSDHPPPPVRVDDLPPSFLKESIDDATYRGDGIVAFLTIVETNNQAALKRGVAAAGEGNRLFNLVRIEKGLLNQLRDELPFLVGACLLLIAGALFLYYRDLKRTALALTPPLLSLIWLFGALRLLGYDVNPLVICCVIFQLGIGLDYAIYALGRKSEGADHCVSRRAIRLSAITTLISFGALLTAESPALFVTGLTISVGVGAAWLASRLLPANLILLLLLVSSMGCSTAPPLPPSEPYQITGQAIIETGHKPRVYLVRLERAETGYRLLLLRPPGIPYLSIAQNKGVGHTQCASRFATCWRDATMIKKGVTRFFACGNAPNCEGPGYQLAITRAGKRFKSFDYQERLNRFRLISEPFLAR